MLGIGSLRAMRSRGALVVVGADGSVRRLDGDTAALADALLEHVDGRPCTRADLARHVEVLTGAPLGDSRVVDDLVALLVETGLLAPSRARASAPRTQARVLVAMGGAIAAAQAPLLAQRLALRGMEVRFAITDRAARFVGVEALEALTHAKVERSLFPDASEPGRVPHLELAAWADVVLVWPATATTIARLASGDFSEITSASALSTRAPVLVAPSMNEAMADAEVVRENLETLAARGMYVTPWSRAEEVADAPDRRARVRGGAPDVETLAQLTEALARTSVPATPSDAASWEAFHRRVPESAHAWLAGEADPAVLRAFDAHAPKGASVWEIGTGPGLIARALADRGARVVATDVSETALARARARHEGAPIVWLRDDVTRSELRTVFDVVVDRGTLHGLTARAKEAYVAAVRAATRPGALVIVTVHTPPGDPRLSTQPMDEPALVALFGDAFEPIAREIAPFVGALDPAPPALTLTLRRR